MVAVEGGEESDSIERRVMDAGKRRNVAVDRRVAVAYGDVFEEMVAYGDVFAEMVALSREMGFSVRVLSDPK